MVREIHQMGGRCRADGRQRDIDRLGIGTYAKWLQHDQSFGDPGCETKHYRPNTPGLDRIR